MLHSADMGRPKQYGELPEYMTFNRAKLRYVVRNPLNQREKSFVEDQRAEAEKAAKAVKRLVDIERQRKQLAEGRPRVAGLVTKWLEDKLPLMPWAPGTRRNYVAKLNRISVELGERTIAHFDCMAMEDWIAHRTTTADAFNDWRYAFVLLWSFAVSRHLADVNEAAKIEERSTSKKIDANKKQRLPLDVGDFKDIREKAEPWLQLAMDDSIVTLQGRSEICNMQIAHFRDGFLYVIRKKVSGDSDMAFIKIALTEQLLEFKSRSLKLDNTASPYVIHRRPDSMRREWIDPKPHWTYITLDYLDKAFAKARDQVKRFAEMPGRQRPSFHEARGLGARLYEAQGMSKAAISALMTHAHKKTTEIYLQGGIAALADTDYQPVVAPLVLRDVLK